MPKKFTKENLLEIMKELISNFQTKRGVVTVKTVLGNFLDDRDGVAKGTSSANLYKQFVKWSMNNRKFPSGKWPSSWLAMSLEELADYLMERE